MNNYDVWNSERNAEANRAAMAEACKKMNKAIQREGELRLSDAYKLLGVKNTTNVNLGWWVDENGVNHFGDLDTREEWGWIR